MKKLKKLFKNYAKTNWASPVATKNNIDANKSDASTYNSQIKTQSLKDKTVEVENPVNKATESYKKQDNINNTFAENKKDLVLDVEKSSKREYSQNFNTIKKVQFGLLIYRNAIELTQENPIWYKLEVKAGQTVVIRAAVQYLNMENIIDRKAVLMISSYDEHGKEVDIPCGQMAKSENLNAYFVYLPSTNNNVKELHSFVVPNGVNYIQLGLSAFNIVEEQKVFIKSLSIKPIFDEYQNDRSTNLNTVRKGLESPVGPSIITDIKKINDNQYFKEIDIIKKSSFGFLIHKDAIELSQDCRVWYELPVQAGQVLVVKAASQYLNMQNITNRKALLIIKSYGDDGKEIDIPCGEMSRSEHLDVYFKYIPSTDNNVTELHNFVVPNGVSCVRLGVCTFSLTERQQVLVKDLSIEPRFTKTSDLITDNEGLKSTIGGHNNRNSSAIEVKKFEKEVYSKKDKDIKKAQFGSLIYKDAIELTQENAIWYDLSVKAGQKLVIKAASQYVNANKVVDRKAVLMINSYDQYGKEVDVPCGRMAKSGVLKAYFKYLPSTSNHTREIHSFVVPNGVSQVHLGLCAFNIEAQQQVFVKNFSIKPKLDKLQTTKFVLPSTQAAEVSIIGWPEVPLNNKPCIIGIMDEFTTGCFEQDVNLIQPRPDNWFALAEKYKPVLFFIESAWQGNYGSWQYRVGQYANKPGNEIDHICQYARDKGIPTLFWNKEDPVHHDKFMCSAKLVDHIYTTDANMKTSYTKKTGNSNVHSLPFAAQPALHKPASLVGRKSRACFAGSWYGERHAERGEAMNWLLKAANNYGLDIYDRNYDNGTFPFPEEYRAGIKGSLPYKELCKEYSRYRIFLNVNSVTESPTMFSRRVFELMASGTPVVSTYAKGIETLFDSDAVWLVNNQEEADLAIRTLMTDDIEWRRRSLAGIREIFSKHTYAHRLNSIFSDMKLENYIAIDARTVLFAKADNLVEIKLLEQFSENQSYRKFCLIIEYTQIDTSIKDKAAENIILIKPGTSKAWAAKNQNGYSIAGWVTPDNHYGEHYLRDLINASIYEPDARGWAKSLDNDVFGYGGPALLSGAVWRMNEFLNYYIDAKANDSIIDAELYLADSDEFEGNIGLERKNLKGTV